MRLVLIFSSGITPPGIIDIVKLFDWEKVKKKRVKTRVTKPKVFVTMFHLKKCEEAIYNDKIQNAIKRNNFKRKTIESPEKAKRDVLFEYEKSFKKKLKIEALSWDTSSGSLIDIEGQQVRMLFKKNSKPIMIPPIGCTQTVVFPYEDHQEPLESLPELSKDALKCIFKFMEGYDLLGCRFVCKKWNNVIVNTHSLWTLHVTRFPDSWSRLSPFRLYIKHMFLNYKQEDVIEFFLKNQDFFVYICGLLLGHTKLTVFKTKDCITVNMYKLSREGLYWGEKRVQLNTFLDAYRIKIL